MHEIGYIDIDEDPDLQDFYENVISKDKTVSEKFYHGTYFYNKSMIDSKILEEKFKYFDPLDDKEFAYQLNDVSNIAKTGYVLEDGITPPAQNISNRRRHPPDDYDRVKMN